MKWSKFCYEMMSFGKRKIEKKVCLLLLLSFSLSSTDVRVPLCEIPKEEKKKKKKRNCLDCVILDFGSFN